MAVQSKIAQDTGLAPMSGPAVKSGPFGLMPMPGGNTRTPASTTTPTTNQQGPSRGNQSFAAVKELQQIILNFSQTLSKNYLMSMDTKNTGQESRPREGQEDPDSLGGSNPFGDFLVNQYVNKSDLVGKQYTNTSETEPVRSGGGATQNMNLRGVINTISVIGTPGSENKPDGIWKTRTNNALTQIAAVATALLNFQKDLKVPVKGYTEDDLKELKNTIPRAYTDLEGPQDIADRCAILSPNIAKLAHFYNNFEEAVLSNEKYKPYIDSSKPLIAVQKKTQFTPQDTALFGKYNQRPIPAVFINQKPVSLADISTSAAFYDFLKANAVNGVNPDANSVIKQIEDQIAAAKAS